MDCTALFVVACLRAVRTVSPSTIKCVARARCTPSPSFATSISCLSIVQPGSLLFSVLSLPAPRMSDCLSAHLPASPTQTLFQLDARKKLGNCPINMRAVINTALCLYVILLLAHFVPNARIPLFFFFFLPPCFHCLPVHYHLNGKMRSRLKVKVILIVVSSSSSAPSSSLLMRQLTDWIWLQRTATTITSF